jgi:hypothetical protein
MAWMINNLLEYIRLSELFQFVHKSKTAKLFSYPWIELSVNSTVRCLRWARGFQILTGGGGGILLRNITQAFGSGPLMNLRVP